MLKCCHGRCQGQVQYVSELAEIMYLGWNSHRPRHVFEWRTAKSFRDRAGREFWLVCCVCGCEAREEERDTGSRGDFLNFPFFTNRSGSVTTPPMSFASPSALSGKKRAAPMTNAEMQQFDALIEDMDIESAS